MSLLQLPLCTSSPMGRHSVESEGGAVDAGEVSLRVSDDIVLWKVSVRDIEEGKNFRLYWVTFSTRSRCVSCEGAEPKSQNLLVFEPLLYPDTGCPPRKGRRVKPRRYNRRRG